jgi:glycyl-tRNA synthetase beta chain
MPDFLLEIGCEEIPARMIDAASRELRERVHKLLYRERLLQAGDISHLDTPRRLAVLAPGISAAQPDVTEQVTGPSVSVAFKDGQPTPAAHAFASKSGLEISQLERTTTPKGEYLSARVTKKGRIAAEVLAESLPKEIASIYWPKNMYWRRPSERFVRPVRWLVAMLDAQVIPLEFDGVHASDQSRGHRILADGWVRIPRAGAAYVEALQRVKVLSRDTREKQIRKTLDAATRTIPGARWCEDKSVLDVVVNLTEWPSAILGAFDPEFLELPEEILVTVMRDHQKYFAVADACGKLLPHFLAVLNTDDDPKGVIRHGHERVLRARFNDARFFWQTDQKHPLRERLEWLKHVTFQKDLGSYYDKTLRVQRSCSWLCEIVRRGGVPIRPGVVHKAACIAKTDLTTELVKEFTELQGIVAGLYTRVQQLDPDLPEATRFAIADAVYDHYRPHSMEDAVARTIEGAVLSIGDKADSIAGMFALGLQPTGSKDPFALRRQGNGIVKTIAEKKLPINFGTLFEGAFSAYEGTDSHCRIASLNMDSVLQSLRFELGGLKPFGDNSVAFSSEAKPVSAHHDDPVGVALGQFLRERVEFYLRNASGYPYDVANAVLAVSADDMLDVLARASAVKEVLHKPEFQAIAAACKRMRNILKQAEEKEIKPAKQFEYLPGAVDEEKSLAAYLEQTASRVEELRSKKDYLDALLLLSTAREPVDRFFDSVMVMVEDERVRANRLALLQTLLREFSTIADFSEVVTEGKESKESSKQ